MADYRSFDVKCNCGKRHTVITRKRPQPISTCDDCKDKKAKIIGANYRAKMRLMK